MGWAGVGSESKTNHLQETFFRIGFTIKNKSFLEELFWIFWRRQMDFAVLFLWGSDGLWGAFFVGVRWTLGCFFLWGSDGLWGAFFVGVRWTLGCFFCGGQMDFEVLFLWGSDGLWGAFFVGVRWTLGCFFCGGQMDFGVLFLWGSDGLWGAFFVGVRWTLGCFFCGGQMDFGVLFFAVPVFNRGNRRAGKKTILQEVLFLGCFFLWGSVVLF